MPAPSVAPDFRTKARAEADRAFDEMTRLAAEEAERVTEEHNRALELAMDDLDQLGARLAVQMRPKKVPLHQNPFCLLLAALLNNALIFGVALIFASGIYSLGVGGAGLIVLDSVRVQTPAFPLEAQRPLHARIGCEEGSTDVHLRPRYGEAATLHLAEAKQPGVDGLPASDSRFVYSVNARSEATLGFWQGEAMTLQIQNGRHDARDATASYATRISVGPGTSSQSMRLCLPESPRTDRD